MEKEEGEREEDVEGEEGESEDCVHLYILPPPPHDHLLCFLVVLGDVSILMEPKHLGVGRDGEATNIVQVDLIFTVLWSIVEPTRGEPNNGGGGEGGGGGGRG